MLLALLGGCVAEKSKDSAMVVVTTNILGDVTQQLLAGTDSIAVEVLMGPGVDPHLYKASQGDVENLSRADLIVYNGLHLEGKMNELFAKLRRRNTWAAAEVLDSSRLINATDYPDAYDPHVWFDPLLWMEVVEGLSQKLQMTFPDHADRIGDNAKEYRHNLEQLHLNNIYKLDDIPREQRVLITAHDAFKYFGKRYQIEVRGLQGISTTAEFGIQDVSSLANYIVARKIPAIFVESSVSPRSIKAVQDAAQNKGWEVQLGGTLYSDALGDKNGPADTYLKMFEYNVETIARALRPKS